VDRDRWERVQALFHEAAERPADEWREWLAGQCGDDPTLIDEVLALLDEDTRTSVLDRDLAAVAGDLLAERRDPPRDLGPYRLREVLGEGGMGVVYLAERVDLHSLVAIKILRDAWLSPARRERFASEQRTLAQLGHASIARLYDADTLPDGTPWFAMEYVDGVTITEYVATHHSGVRPTLELFRAVCEAVLHAHQHAVIHRDLKPSNVLVTRGGQPKLLDFGIAKQIEDLAPPLERTRTELRMMTPAYAAPEQIRGEGLGVHTDVYALGAMLYELLAGRPAFDLRDKTPAEAADLVTTQMPERPSLAARNGPRAALLGERGASWSDLDVLCLTALQKEPARRYRSVESLIRDVDHYLRGEPLEARPDSIGYRMGKFVRRHWRPLAAASAVTLAVVGLTAFYTVRLARARQAAVAEAARTHRIQEFMNGLFEGGDPEAGPSDTLRVVALLARGVRDAGALTADPAVQGELYETLGGIYQTLGQLEMADSMLRTSLAVRRAKLGPDSPDVARSQTALGLLRSNQSEYEEAERFVRDGLATVRRQPRLDLAALARATTALGTVLEARGVYDTAIVTLTEAVRLDSVAKLPLADLSETLTELANTHFYAGHYGVADALNHRVYDIDRALYGGSHPHVASDLYNLGAVQQEWGHWPEAEHYYRRSLAIYRGWYGEDHFETAATLNAVGRALIQEEKLAEAREPLARALAIREHIYGPVHPSVASTLNEIAMLAQNEGRYDDAEAGFRRMIDIYRKVYDDKHYLIGLAYSNLGGLFLERKDYPQAEQQFREALRRYATTLPPGHLYFGITRVKLGRALLRAGRYAEAVHESRGGYDVLTKQSEPPTHWLENACNDLALEYDALNDRENAARFRAELAKDSTSAAALAATH
jgi:serine/threonine-protein kinase